MARPKQEEQQCDAAPTAMGAGSRAHRDTPQGMRPATSLQRPQLWKTIKLWLKEHRSIPDPIHSQKSLCIPKHSYFPQLTDILNKSTVYFGCH